MSPVQAEAGRSFYTFLTCRAPLRAAQVLNYEDGQGEDSMATIPDVKAPSGDKEDVLGAHSSFRDHRAESEAGFSCRKFMLMSVLLACSISSLDALAGYKGAYKYGCLAGIVSTLQSVAQPELARFSSSSSNRSLSGSR